MYDRRAVEGFAPHEARAIHQLHELRERLLIATQRAVYDRDHVCFTPRNDFAVFAMLIAVQYLLDTDSNWRFRSSARASRLSLGKLGMLRRLSVTDVIVFRGGASPRR